MKLRHLIAILLGMLLAAVFTPAWTQAERSTPGYDQERHRPIGQFRVMGTDGREVGRVLIQNGRFHCNPAERRAFLLLLTGGVWVGCARDEGVDVKVRFEDGDELIAAKGPQT